MNIKDYLKIVSTYAIIITLTVDCITTLRWKRGKDASSKLVVKRFYAAVEHAVRPISSD